MESLLRWSIENSNPQNGTSGPPREPQDLDPDIIDMILGRPDAVLMKEALATGVDGTQSVEDRVIALDNLEMLVEQIDNANKIDLSPLKMFPQIISLLSPQNPDPIRMQALWILGTAVQNNPQAQADLLTHDPLSKILSILSPIETQTDNSVSPQTRSKAAYALSAMLKHNPTAVSRINEIGGWKIMRDALQDSDITIRRKIAFLINTLLLPTSVSESEPIIHATLPSTRSLTESSKWDGVVPLSTSSSALTAVRSNGIVAVLVHSLISPVPFGPDADQEVDLDYSEKAARALVTFLEVGGSLTSEEKDLLRGKITSTNSGLQVAWSLDEKAWEVLKRGVGNA